MLEHGVVEGLEPEQRGSRSWLDRLLGPTTLDRSSLGDGGSNVEEESLARRALGKRGAATYQRVVGAEQKIRSAALQTARAEFAEYESHCETANGLLVESGLRDARRLGKQLYRKIMVHRQPTHRDNKGVAAALEKLKREEDLDSGVTQTRDFHPPPRSEPMDHKTHVIPRS